MNENEQKGYDFAGGACICLGKFAVIGFVILWCINTAGNIIGWGVDDSDRDAWNRSGLTIHTDAKTGVQYLSDGKGGLTRREYGKATKK